MAALSTSAEYDLVRQAIQTLSGNANAVASFTVDGQNYVYRADQLPRLMEREAELANRMCNANRRKRTSPDFSYESA